MDLVNTLQELNALDVGFVSLSEALDLTTSSGRALAGMLAVFAEFERDILRDRVKAGIDQARKDGKPHGRPMTAGKLVPEMKQLRKDGLSKREIAKRLGISRTSVIRWLAVRGKSLARSRARELRSLARHEEEVNAWSFTTTRNTARGRKPLAPFGLRAAQAHLLRCPSSAMLWHGLRWFALHLHPWRPQRGPRDFYHGLLGPPKCS